MHNTTKYLLSQSVTTWYTQLVEVFPELLPPTVTFFTRGKTAGTADYTTNIISLNAALAGECKDNLTTFCSEIIPHEIAHLIADNLGSTGHDKIWRGVMATIGVPANTCHTMCTKSVAVKQDYSWVHWTNPHTEQHHKFATRKEFVETLFNIMTVFGEDYSWVYTQARSAGVKASTVRVYVNSLITNVGTKQITG
jgi:predicted SprT family Zn-dependent metalloprotease